MSLVVGIAFRIADELIAEIEAAVPSIEIRRLYELGDRRTDLDPEEKARVKAAMAEIDILFGSNAIPAEYFDDAHRLQWFQVITAGVDNMARDGLLSRGFQVTNARGLAAVPIAEWVLGGMIMLTKGMHTSVQDQAQRRWNFRFTAGLEGKTCAIIGMGAIGREVAKRAHAFGMRIIATRRTVVAGDSDNDCDALFPYTDLPDVLAQADYVVLCVPLTPETVNCIGAAELAAMKPNAFLLNIARGQCVDQEALCTALKDGKIGGAALDVTNPEPLPAESPLWDLPNVIITPHISGAVEGYGHRAAKVFLANLQRFVNGEALENLVNPELGY